jgi:phosphate transport system substrate-binding protein
MTEAPGRLLTTGLLTCISLLAAGITGGRDGNVGAALAQDRGAPITLLGVGASFPAPLYERWFSEYNKLHPEVQVNYQTLGSGAAIRQFQNGLIDFAASEAAMTDEEISAARNGVVMLPMAAGSVVLTYNLPGGPSELKLSRDAYSQIFLGKVTQWNDPIIAKNNPGQKLPDTRITVVAKSDASGTTFVFTAHLSAISEAWKNGPGTGKAVNFPVGVAAKGTLGVTALIKQIPGAIGFIEYGYARQTGLPMAVLENRAGKFVKPDLKTGTNALAGIKLPADLRAWLPDPPGEDSYPIVTYTWLLCYRKYRDPRIAQALKFLIRYGLAEGQGYSIELGYIPLPADVVRRVTSALGQIS